MSLQHRVVPNAPKRSRKPKDTPGIGHNAHSLRDFARRIESLDDEIACLNADKSSIYREAKVAQYDVKILRKVISYRRACEKRGADTLADEDTLFQHYLSEIEGQPPRVHAHAREAVDPTTGEITEVSSGDEPVRPAPAEPAADKGSASNSEIGTKLETAVVSASVAGHGADESPAPTHPKPKDAGPVPPFLIREQPGRGA